MGFDSKRIQRKLHTTSVTGEPEFFQACLGVGVRIDNLDTFIRQYELKMDQIFSEVGLRRTKKIYNSYDLKQIFISRRGVSPIQDVFEALIPEVEFIEVFYAYFLNVEKDEEHRGKPPQPMEIDIFTNHANRKKTVSGIQFLDEIAHPFAAISAWAYIKKLGQLPDNLRIVCDDVSFKPCHAWNELCKTPNFQIVPRGDQCNYVISCADIFTSAIDEILLEKNAKLNKDLVHLFPKLSKKIDTTMIGSKWLWGIKPTHDCPVDVSEKLARPLFIIVPSSKELFNTAQKKLLETAPFLTDAYHAAARNMGSVKFFDPIKDPLILTDMDYLVYYDDTSKEKVEYLLNLGIPSKPLNSKQLNEI